MNLMRGLQLIVWPWRAVLVQLSNTSGSEQLHAQPLRRIVLHGRGQLIGSKLFHLVDWMQRCIL